MFVMGRCIGSRRGMTRICELPWSTFGLWANFRGKAYEKGLRFWCCCRKVFVSFGGLLLYIEGPYKNLSGLRQDYVYLCLKK